MKKIIDPICKEKFWINYYGAYYIDPNNLVFWICVNSDEMKFILKSNNDLLNKLKQLFYKHNYPLESINYVYIGFESQETVDRESNGDWYVHFK